MSVVCFFVHSGSEVLGLNSLVQSDCRILCSPESLKRELSVSIRFFCVDIVIVDTVIWSASCIAAIKNDSKLKIN